MYSQSKVAQRLEEARREFNIVPTYFGPSDIDEFNARLKREGKFLYDSAGAPDSVQNLSPADADFILQNQILAQCDAVYYLTRYAFLKNQDNVIQRFRFRVPQRIYFDIICDLEERDASIEIMALKARQLGVSIFTELLIGHRIIFSKGVNAIIASADQTKTTEMSKMLFLAYDMLPVWIRPRHTSRVESDRGKLLFGRMASGVSFQHGSQKYGIGTGSTPTIYHLSEVALYGDAAEMLVDEGLWKAVHASPAVFGALESTGRSNKGWWATTWYYSKENWPNSRMYPMFLPWYCGTDIYPTPTDMRTRPIPPDWTPHRETQLHMAKAAMYVASMPLLHKHMIGEQVRRGVRAPSDARPWELPREQQWFWEWNFNEAKSKGKEASWYQEMAGDDVEALQRSAESVFGHDTIERIDLSRDRKYTLWGVTGQSIEDRQEPPPAYIDYTKTRLPVRFQGRKPEQTYSWELVPLRQDPPPRENEPEDIANNLIVFEPPLPNLNYSIGVDTSAGKGLDSTVISVWSIGGRGVPDRQVAELSSPYINHVEVYAFVFAVAAYYGQHMPYMQGLGTVPTGTYRWPMPYITVEQVEAVGDVCQGQMMRMGYPYASVHKFVRLDSSPKKIARAKRSTSTKPGWYTYGWSRPILTGNFVAFVQNNWAEVNSPWLLEEMKEYEVHYNSRGKERMEHSDESNDDRIMAAAMAVFCPQDLRLLAERAKARLIENLDLPPIDIAPYLGQTYSLKSSRESTPLSLEDVIYSNRSQLERFTR